MSKKVFVGMSGGVDSSVTAALLQEKGYDVEGINLILTPDDDGSASRDAKAVAEKLSIPFHILDLRKEFDEKVIRYFVNEYVNGRTPNPCAKCNETIKFGVLLEKGMELGADYIATGHYAKIEYDATNNKYYLKRSTSSKDQSYFLSRLNQYQLSHTLFPVNEFEKQDTRKIAEQYDLIVAKKKDSQEICFVKDKDYAGFINRYTNSLPKPGKFVDLKGNVLGEHKGIIYYTIGQRKGLGIAFGEPMFVTSIDAAKNEIMLAPQGHQLCSECLVEDLNYISFDKPLQSAIHADVKIRCQAKPSPAEIIPINDNVVKVEFDEPQRAVTPGQIATIYDGDTVIGGGYISI